MSATKDTSKDNAPVVKALRDYFAKNKQLLEQPPVGLNKIP